MKKGLKKALLGIGLSVMTLGASALVGCSPMDDVKGWVDQIFCKHETKEIVEEVAPTCTEDGYTEYEKCLDCGKEVTKGAVIEATGHKIEVTKGYAATCTTLGMTDGKACTVCEEVIEEAKILPALGHVKEKIEACEATCETNGYTGGYKCKTCDAVVEGEIILAFGHSYDDGIVTKEATCEADGEKTFTCATCEDTEVEIIPATGHVCQNETCTVCGKIVNITDLTGYTFVWNDYVEEDQMVADGAYSFTWDVEFTSDLSDIEYEQLKLDVYNYYRIYYICDDYGMDEVYDAFWNDPNCKTIHITGGEDATDADLIRWMVENGTFMKSEAATN